jgi:hypothetical protein
MTDRMRVIVEGQDNASDEFRRIGQNATNMGRQVDAASDVMERGFRGVNAALDSVDRNTAETVRAINRLVDAQNQAARSTENLDRTTDRFSKTGAAVGAVMSTTAGILSEFARAAAEEEVVFDRLEAAVAATGAEFDALSPAIDRAIAGAEDLSFADDQAAEALTRLTTTTGSTEEALDLLGLTMDVARGRGISLAAAADLVGKVAGGNIGILSRYGIVLEEGATATEALASLQARYADQSETYAATQQGAIDRLKNSFDNWAESVGASTGDLQVLLTLLPGLSVGFTGLTTIVGGLAGALGPIGLIAAAVAAVGAVAYMTDGFGLFAGETERAALEVDGLTDAIYALAAAGASPAVVGMAEEIAAGWTAAQDAFNEYIAFVQAAEGGPQQTAGTVEDLIPDPEQVEAANALLASLAGYLDDANFNSRGLTDSVNFLIQQLISGAITFEQFLAYLTLYNDQSNELFGTLEETATNTRLLADATDALGDTFERMTEIGQNFADRQDEINAGLAEAARLNAEADAARSGALAAGQAELEQQRARSQARAAEAEAAAEQEDAVLAAAAAYRVEAVSLDDAALAMGSMGYASFAAIDGVVSLTEQERLLTVQSAELAAQQSAVASELGAYRGAVNDMAAAYDILIARQQAGEQLNQDQLDFIAEFEAESAGHQRAIEDLVIQQGLLADAQLDNAAASESLTDSIEGLVEPLTIIAEALAEIAGIDLDNLNPPEGAAASWADIADSFNAIRGAPVQPATSAGGEGTGGPYPQGQGIAGGGGSSEITMRVVVETADAFAELTAVQERAEFVMDGPAADGWTMEIQADGEQAFALIRDVDGDVVRLVTADYTVVIDGDGLSAKEEISAVSMALANLDGSHATVYADADTSAARAEIDSLLGFQGRGYVIIDGIGGQRVGPTDLTLASGGVVPAASGRVVRAGEIGPELVYPPGGAPYVAAAHGLYAMETGSVVSNAPTTRAALQGGRRSRPIVIAGPVTVVANNPRQFMAEMQAIGR